MLNKKIYAVALIFALILPMKSAAMRFFNPYDVPNEPLFPEVEDLKMDQEHERNNQINKEKIRTLLLIPPLFRRPAVT